MGEFPVNPENGPEYISYDAFQYIAWSVSALPASGTEISDECLSAILAHARLIIKYRRLQSDEANSSGHYAMQGEACAGDARYRTG